MQSSKNVFRLEHVLESIDKIESVTKHISDEQFTKDWIIQDAVIRNLEVIGEAINNVDEELKKKWPGVPWAEAKGIRNILIHEYFRVNPKEVWATVKENLPKLKKQITKILQDIVNNQ